MAQIEISDLTFCYEGRYDNIFEHASLRLDTDWHTGLVGRNGLHQPQLLRQTGVIRVGCGGRSGSENWLTAMDRRRILNIVFRKGSGGNGSAAESGAAVAADCGRQ